MIPPIRGIVSATLVPFRADYSVDEAELKRLVSWIAGHDGISGIATNGIAGEVFALSSEERARVTRIAAGAAGADVPVISGVYTDSIDEGVEHGLMARDAGARALLVMPQPRWLRYGMADEHVLEYFTRMGEATGLRLVAHVYPSWTKATYGPRLLAKLAQLPFVGTFKLGPREISVYEASIRAIRAADAEATILTCQDEFLLPSMVQGVDGALVGFASFVPDRIVELYRAVSRGDLNAARQVYDDLQPLTELVYGSSHPSYENYPRMKTAMLELGLLATDVARRPIEPRSAAAVAEIRSLLGKAGMAPAPTGDDRRLAARGVSR